MLNQLQTLEDASQTTPIITVAELRAYLPEGFVKKLDCMDALISEFQEVMNKFHEENPDVIENIKKQAVELENRVDDLSEEELAQEGEKINQMSREVLPKRIYEIEEELSSIQTNHTTKIDGADGEMGVYVECSYSNFLGADIQVKVGNYYYDENDKFRTHGTDYDYAQVRIPINESGVEYIALNRFRTDDGRDPRNVEEQQAIKEDALKVLTAAKHIDAGIYVDLLEMKSEIWRNSCRKMPGVSGLFHALAQHEQNAATDQIKTVSPSSPNKLPKHGL